MNETMTFTWSCPRCGENGNYGKQIVMSFDSEGMDIYDFVDACKSFARAIGYCESSIERGFDGED